MNHTNEPQSESAKGIAPLVMGSIKQSMAQAYAREKAEKIFRKKSATLTFAQWDTVLQSLARVTAMLRLVGHNAWQGRQGPGFNRDVHAAMEMAMHELDQVTGPLHGMAPAKLGRQKALFSRGTPHDRR
ncbi:MAG: hypothetical protein HQL95_04865 [Magnetococcales bacterium]|nr:hypothetical protein [Magnetococcales bacterium]